MTRILKKIVLFAFLVPYLVHSQNKGSLSIELQSTVADYKMSSAYNYISLDTVDNILEFNEKSGERNSLNKGYAQGINLSFQPLKFLDFGLTASYQFSEYRREASQPFSWTVANKAQSFSVGVSTTLFLNKLLNFENSKISIAKRFIVSLRPSFLLGRSIFSEKAGSEGIGESRHFNFQSNHLLYRAELGLGYKFFDRELFSIMGLKVGYQRGTTFVLKSFSGQVLKDIKDNQVALDFSGFYYGIYFNIGK